MAKKTLSVTTLPKGLTETWARSARMTVSHQIDPLLELVRRRAKQVDVVPAEYEVGKVTSAQQSIRQAAAGKAERDKVSNTKVKIADPSSAGMVKLRQKKSKVRTGSETKII